MEWINHWLPAFKVKVIILRKWQWQVSSNQGKGSLEKKGNFHDDINRMIRNFLLHSQKFSSLPVMLLCANWIAFKASKRCVTPSFGSPINSRMKLGKERVKSSFNFVNNSVMVENCRFPISNISFLLRRLLAETWNNFKVKLVKGTAISSIGPWEIYLNHI